MLKLYEKAQATGNPFALIDYRKIALEIGQKEIAIKNIIKDLAQANFLKKGEGTTVCLTEQGRAFVLDLAD